MLLPHPLDIIALLLGIFLSIRKSEVRSEDPAAHPNVSAEAFARWQDRAMRAYALGARACFGRVFADFVFFAVLHRVEFPDWLRWGIGVSIDAGWVALLVICWLRARDARKLKTELGIAAQQPAA